MDAATVQVYEAQAGCWVSLRTPLHRAEAAAFAGRVGGGPVADLGCGPGWYASEMPAPVLALDAARSMLDLVGANAPLALRVQGDLEALPVRRGALRGAWARNSYVHLPRASLPLALADLHGALAVGAPVELTFFGGEVEGVGLFPRDDVPGRFFSLWETALLRDVVVGAGFDIDELAERINQHGERAIDVRARRARTLPDTVRAGMRLLVCGLNPSLYAADRRVGYARGSNRFWTAAAAAGLVTRDRDPRHAAIAHGVGMTDLVKRATVSAAELTAAEYREGLARVERLVAWLRPRAVCFVGLAGCRAAVDPRAGPGVQARTIGGAPAYVMPSTSGLNARSSVAELAEHLRRAAMLAGP